MRAMKKHDDCLLRLMAQREGVFDGSSHSTLTADVQTKCIMQALRLLPRKEYTPCGMHSCLILSHYSKLLSSHYKLEAPMEQKLIVILKESAASRKMLRKYSWQTYMLFIARIRYTIVGLAFIAFK